MTAASSAFASFGLVVGTFAITVTLWIVLAVGLVRSGQRASAVVTLVVPPVGVILAYRAGLRRRAVALAVALGVYLIVRAWLG